MIQIIPVIDLMGGQVVHARGGIRSHYQPVKSLLSSSSEPMQLIADLLTWYPFQQLYIADLDAIGGQVVDAGFYRQLARQFPQLQLWLDAGISTLADYQQLSRWPNILPVLGSESLSAAMLTDWSTQAAALSLDFKQGQLLGHTDWLQQAQYWPERVIAMALDAVGAQQGPDMELLRRLLQHNKAVQLYAAGGVRNEQDLRDVHQLGVSGVLLASALHSGQISQSLVAELMEQESRCS